MMPYGHQDPYATDFKRRGAGDSTYNMKSIQQQAPPPDLSVDSQGNGRQGPAWGQSAFGSWTQPQQAPASQPQQYAPADFSFAQQPQQGSQAIQGRLQGGDANSAAQSMQGALQQQPSQYGVPAQAQQWGPSAFGSWTQQQAPQQPPQMHPQYGYGHQQQGYSGYPPPRQQGYGMPPQRQSSGQQGSYGQNVQPMQGSPKQGGGAYGQQAPQPQAYGQQRESFATPQKMNQRPMNRAF